MARKRTNVFNLSFLDIMSCGFGAVVLFYMIISAQVATRSDQANSEVLSESNRLEEEVLEGRKNLVRLRNTVESKQEQEVIAEGEITRMQELLAKLKVELAQYDGSSLATQESIEALRADIKSLEEAKNRLAAEAETRTDDPGRNVRQFVGEGNRQYLTGMKMGGQRVLILVDGSASMLGRTYVNVIRYRNMQDDKKVKAPKWQSVLRTVDWITAQIPPASRFKIAVFNDGVEVMGDGEWQRAADGVSLDAAVKELNGHVPQGGSNLYAAFQLVKNMDVKPDNIYLITDGLPTIGKSPPSKTVMVSPENRMKYFEQSVKVLGTRIPVNVMLFPMDGDPAAAGLMWELAYVTKGSMMTPSSDWP